MSLMLVSLGHSMTFDILWQRIFLPRFGSRGADGSKAVDCLSENILLWPVLLQFVFLRCQELVYFALTAFSLYC
jgi:hypothetical protein